MKVTLLSYGSRGDIQPFLALATGLQKAGHSVRLAAPERFTSFIESYQVPCQGLPGDPEEISLRFNDAGQNPLRIIHALSAYIFEIAPEVARTALAACEDADCIVHGFLFTAGGHAFACQLGIPDVSVQTFPMFAPTRAFPNVSVAKLPPGGLSYFSHWLFDRVFRWVGNNGYARIRRTHPDIGLPAKLPWPFEASPSRLQTPLVFAFSPSVIRPPREWLDQVHIHTPGYFFLDDAAYQPENELVEFLEAGEAPVCITFGSMVNRKLKFIRSIVGEALQGTQQRAIFLTGWGDRRAGPELGGGNLLELELAAHDWLFPRCKLIIHHGGAGTTAAALRSGRPSMVIPLAGDQPFWARRVNELRVGPGSITIQSLTAERLRAAIALAGGSAVKQRAEEVGDWLGAEDGVGKAVRLIEGHTARFRAENGRRQP